MNNTISVIVPVYNVASYLPEALDSVCGQTYKDLEIILIDDGSTDSSPEICDRYAQLDNRIKVIHQINGGAANAKNTGLRYATGQYLAFLDSDDYLEPDAYAYMHRILVDNYADVVQCSHRNRYKNSSLDKAIYSEPEVLSNIEFLLQFTKNWTCGLLWNKLYKRSLYEGIFFEEGHKIDDEYFTYQGIMKASKIICDRKIVYNYRMRKSGVMLSESSQKQILEDKLDYLTKRRELVTSKYPSIAHEYNSHFLNMLLILSKADGADEQYIRSVKFTMKKYMKVLYREINSLALVRSVLMLLLLPENKLVSSLMVVAQPNCDEYYE